MKILQLCKKFPFPLKDGESLASTFLARALNELGASVTLLSMNTSKHPTNIATLPAWYNHYQAIHAVDVDNHIRPWDALTNLLFSSESYHVNRFVNEDFSTQLVQLLKTEQYDIVHLETLFLSSYIPLIRKHSKAKVVMRSHNVEHRIWERVAINSHPLKRWYLQAITPRLRNYEIEHLNKYDLFAAITAGDLEDFKKLGLQIPSTVVPIGLDCRSYEPDYSAYGQPVNLSFIGSLDWMPNIEGLKWFLDEIWMPLLYPNFPNLEFHIAGRNTPDWLLRLQMPGVTVHGEVPSARAFLNSYPITIAPLLSGGGMRAKILEGMALGRVVISTAVGLEGIDASHGHNALIANTPNEWLETVRWCVQHPQLLRGIGEQSELLCNEHYDNLKVGKRLLEEFKVLVGEEASVLV
jgi:polysaccharide biosynthesis protein PslH